MFVGWLVLGYGYQLRLPLLRGARLRHRHDGKPLVLVGPADDPDRPRGRVRRRRCGRRVAVRRAREKQARRWVIAAAALGVAVWSLAGVITSSRGSQAGADAFVAHLPQPLDWVDRLTHRQSVTYLGQALGSNYDFGLGLTEFWNRSVDNIWTLDGSSPGPGPGLTPDLARRERPPALRPGRRPRARGQRGQADRQARRVAGVADAAPHQPSVAAERDLLPARARRLDRLGRRLRVLRAGQAGNAPGGGQPRGLLQRIGRADAGDRARRPARAQPTARRRRPQCDLRATRMCSCTAARPCRSRSTCALRLPCACMSASSCGRPTTARASPRELGVQFSASFKPKR